VAHGDSRACNAQAEAQSSKSFLVLFFKKEQKERASFLKKRSKKLFSIWLWFTGCLGRLSFAG
jgi:hypothetical protein